MLVAVLFVRSAAALSVEAAVVAIRDEKGSGALLKTIAVAQRIGLRAELR